MDICEIHGNYGMIYHYRKQSVPAIEKLFPRALVRHIPDAGHLLHVDKPAEFLTALTDFVM